MNTEVIVVIGAGGVGQAIARRRGTGRIALALRACELPSPTRGSISP